MVVVIVETMISANSGEIKSNVVLRVYDETPHLMSHSCGQTRGIFDA